MTVASAILLASLPLLVTYYAEKYRVDDLNKAFPNEPSDFGLPVPETFDFIIVGGGTAGCVVANRLSEKYSVLLLEAGGNPPPIQSVPYPWIITQEYPEINFLYKSTPQNNAKLNNGGENNINVQFVLSTSGKMMGGSSSHNGMTYQRGHPEDFDRWADVSGDESCRYLNVVPFFRRAERYAGQLNVDKDIHGNNGTMMTIEDEFSPGRELWLEAGRELGYEVNDPNRFQRVGFHIALSNKEYGRRVSTYVAYIKPIEKTRKNLKIYRYSYVSNVIIDPKTKTAQAVQYTRHGIPRVAFASKEIILSAGSYISPIILIKSGIGPLDQLKAAKVVPISILPVGQNLMDHPYVMVGPIHVDKPEYAWNIETDLSFDDITHFLDGGKGPLAGVRQGSAGAFIDSTRRAHWPEIQLYYSAYSPSDANAINGFVGINAERSRGTIKLNTTAVNMADNNLPLIDFNYFADPTDIDIGVEGIKTFLKIIEDTEAFKGIGARYIGKVEENCKHLTFRSDEYWRCFIVQTTETTWHASSTCRMGKAVGDPSAVVDPRLRVIGVKKLRVIDASIMPYTTNANTHAPVVMIGEKGAQLILDDYKNDEKSEPRSEL